jgi:hypothetical protein
MPDLTPDARYDQVSPRWLIEQLRTENAALRAALVEYREMAQAFVSGVECGQIRSHRTYNRMKELIDGTASLGI